MKRRVFQLSLAAAALALGTTSFAQTKWDLPAAYPATNFHSVNLATFAADVDKASAGKLKITVHPRCIAVQGP
jgi:TRAP-type C4-dicarboxylate transport system substrate-binding protein